MSPSSGDALLCFVKRAVPAGSKGTNWYRQSSGCCGGVVTQAYGQPDNPVDICEERRTPAILTAAPFR
ncbi:hypothetical protein, partial [Escherichia coli]|uniref:hypothetical protein n=1 Tax=Escherichia coli TaxID=562 RepID=UPI0008FC053D